MRLDHLAVSARTLDEGTAHVEAALGVAPGPGGAHPLMGTHNRLLGMGDIYLEVIAIDPGAKAPEWPRWFDLNNFSGPPRLTNWIAGCESLSDEIAAGPPGLGVPLALSRGDLHWQMAVPASGRLPFDDAFPALIEWQGSAHPVQRLPDSGLRLVRLRLLHPEADALRAALAGRIADPRIEIAVAPRKALMAEIMTPAGLRRL